ncbi:hypothetical protein Q73A0000_10010 [Kaistella flava (ex Peng et al. 2021)]|uniref:Uncharacterized protein n=1 Tax=Kaistella flava (ex Peng et al. 2021) TaxID=2038776 RepID=A0A7M2YAU8_9FLAO|nr:hypothetical protein [Kaistella flava (ex Peng et al. 2021)]QOW10684.1 hypothetical protein Q73A0000_10010 [Kaistella flava (ex Peng et al. 2021)]
MKTLYSILVLTMFTNCQPIAKALTGISTPKEETTESILDFLEKAKMDTSNIFVVKDEKSYYPTLKLFSNSFPEALLFDKNGNELIYKETVQSCNAGLFATIPNLNTTSELKKGNLQIENVLNTYAVPLLKNNVILETQCDYYLIINWGKFIGKLNRDHVKVWEDLAKANNKVKIKVIKLNIDLQKNWEHTENKKL